MRGPQKDKEVGLVLKALAFAASKHRDPRRKDADAWPCINHPIALAEVLWHEGGIRGLLVIAAALLHDSVEDTEIDMTILGTCHL
jgi:guanosine-3',5'-bis(diphosphate) 3'-pyrophosphohydrolase